MAETTSVPPGVESPLVFLDIRIGEESVGRVVLELWEHLFPSTVANFVAIAKGSARGSSGNLLSYKGTRIHKVIPNFAIQGGDAVNNDGTGSDSIFGKVFPNEGPWISHDEPGLLGMASNGRNTNGCQFYITTVPGCAHLNGQHTVFGRVVRGMGVIRQVEMVRTHNDIPDEEILIENCGIYEPGMLLGPEDPFGDDIYPPFPEDCPPNFLNFRSLQDVINAAARMKIVGNAYYKKEQFVKAHLKYKKALRYLNKYQDVAGELAPHDEVALTQAVLPNLLNSAACKIKLKMYDQALEDCNEILDTSPNHPKAFYRRGQAYHGKRDYERAIKDLIKANKLVPTDPSILAELKACRGEMATYCAKEKKACVKYFADLNNSKPTQGGPLPPQQQQITQHQQQHFQQPLHQMPHMAVNQGSVTNQIGIPQRIDAVAHSSSATQPLPGQSPHFAGPSRPVEEVTVMQTNSDDSDEMMS